MDFHTPAASPAQAPALTVTVSYDLTLAVEYMPIKQGGKVNLLNC